MTPPTTCPHPRVREFVRQLLPGPPHATLDPRHRPAGYHVAQGGICLACGKPVRRVSAHVALGAWDTVGEIDPAAVEVRRRRAG